MKETDFILALQKNKTALDVEVDVWMSVLQNSE